MILVTSKSYRQSLKHNRRIVQTDGAPDKTKWVMEFHELCQTRFKDFAITEIVTTFVGYPIRVNVDVDSLA